MNKRKKNKSNTTHCLLVRQAGMGCAKRARVARRLARCTQLVRACRPHLSCDARDENAVRISRATGAASLVRCPQRARARCMPSLPLPFPFPHASHPPSSLNTTPPTTTTSQITTTTQTTITTATTSTTSTTTTTTRMAITTHIGFLIFVFDFGDLRRFST